MRNSAKTHSLLRTMRNPAPSSRLQVLYGLPGGFRVSAHFGDLIRKRIADIVPSLARERSYTVAQLLGPGLWSEMRGAEARMATLYVSNMATKGTAGLTVVEIDGAGSVRFALARSQQKGKQLQIVVHGRAATNQVTR